MKSVALHNLGCKVNAYEMDVMQQMLQERGYKIVSFDERADIYIVNTCTVTNIADRKSRQILHRAKKINPDAVVVAVGCYVQTGKENIEKDDAIDLAVGNNKKKDLVTILETFLEERTKEYLPSKTLNDTTMIDINNTDEFENMLLKKTAEHTRAYLKIQDGCNQFCSYCVIPNVRGRVRSRQVSDILKEAQSVSANGYKEIVLTGIHISSYGIDLKEENMTLLSLVEQLHQIKGIERIRLGSLEPRIVTEQFANTLAGLSKICPHFHLSLQSGCDETLKRMNRRYSTDEYRQSVQKLRRAFENPAITTDIIVGFPGETEEEFLMTQKFLEEIQFFEMHIFKYSKRQGTKAADMKNQISEQVKTQRSHILLQMEQLQSKKFRESYFSKKVEVLFEEEKVIEGKSHQVGHTKEYVKTAIETDEILLNQIVKGKLVRFLNKDIIEFCP